MTPEAIIEDRRFQETLDKIRKEEGYDFAAIAFYESNKPSSINLATMYSMFSASSKSFAVSS